ncbi:tetratricopeptide [Patellaria atrata CBS 101060]|uniref:Tetratricopeptide n=1 Tax=Patellaria atrata CBS 101060 TaxID=1346257 RepID=A0A9P4VQ03_9PEZI|nr:tetratricopeptide [Patellaria atrata CBS 101060]
MNGHNSNENGVGSLRFTDVPDAVDVPVGVGDDGEVVEVDLLELLDDPTELCTLLENENVEKKYWMMIALAYAKQKKVEHAIDIMTKSLAALSRGRSDDKLSILSCLCWLYLWKCREAPRVKPEGQLASEARTKDYYIQSATGTLNEASRISPSYPPLFLARGVLYLLRASLQPPTKPGSGSQDNPERIDTLRQASKCFDDALRASGGRNLMAVLGKARVQYSLGKYAEALQCYQAVMERSPELIDPDPRIGIGCCFWQLGHKDDAKTAWERSLELNPDSKIANILLGLYHLNSSSQFVPTDPNFAATYRKAIMQYTQKSFKLDDKLPLTCSTFASYFLTRKQTQQVERLARRAIELTDVNAIASDGWYLLARKEHFEDDIDKASEYYLKADQARGGDERGYLPAKFGIAQIKALTQDYDGAKFRLEKIIQQSKSTEAMTLLGTLYAEDVFSSQTANIKEDKSAEAKKAISLLESVRLAWKDPKRRASPDSAVLLNLARLYEVEHPDKSLQCLQQVEEIEMEGIPEEDKPDDIDDPVALKNALRTMLPPELTNNMGCFHYQAEKYPLARELFQTALNACINIGQKNPDADSDALVTTISYNLARTYEAEGLLDEAKKVYEGLLERHQDYTDANTRLTYIALRQSPTDEGPKAISKLFQNEAANLEVRSLYGWYLSKAKKRTSNFAEDQEQRHYKHTLQQFDKHDRYSLTGMGNIYLSIAREMRRETDQEKEKRRKMYEKAVEFFDKALQLDPRNAYAAQGIGIALVEDKKDFGTAVQIFLKVRETMKDASVFVNLGHAFCELKQYSRAIENYETALAKDRARDPQVLACLGRVWLMKGKQEKSVQAMKTSLEYSQRALEVAPEQIHFKFNVAFVQIQIAQLIYTLPDSQRTLEEVETAALGLDQAIESFSAIAKSPNPPFPRGDIEQRANMGRNTMRKQLERAVQNQREYEQKHAARLQQAREAREAEIRKREEARRQAEEAANEQKRKIAEERQKMQEKDRELAELRAEEERRREEAEMTTDSETGERRKRVKKKGGAKRKKKTGGEEDETDGEVSDGGSKRRSTAASATPASSGDERPRQKKKRKLERKSKTSSKYKSSERIVDSDEDDEALAQMNGNEGLAAKINTPGSGAEESMADEDEEGGPVSQPRKKTTRVIEDDDEDEEALENDADIPMKDAFSGSNESDST